MAVSTEYVEKVISKIQKAIKKSIYLQKYEDALYLISICANILYQTNIYYKDDNLENAIDKLALEMKLNEYLGVEEYAAREDYVLFYDGFGLNDRGLIQIYLKALCKIKRVIYVTYEDRKMLIPDIQNILVKYKCEKRYIRRENHITEQIVQLNEVVKEFRPKRMFFYSLPDDVVATPILFAYKGLLIRYQINLTDHAFWLGAKCIDKCIEFRNYGAIISNEYRKIDAEKIVIIPFYPIVHRDKKFQGFPFDKKAEQKVIFSGGALYKTLGGDNKYYEIVDYILGKYQDAIFWYAGSGNDFQMRKIINKYPKRAFLTPERSDLLQMLENCDVYLSTYPMCGGLMFQYAAIAGKVPVTLKSGRISDDFLINQGSINVEFVDTEHLYAELDKLLLDKDYAKNRSEIMKKSVISAEAFDEEVRKLIEEKIKTYTSVRIEETDTKRFREWYLDSLTETDIDAMYVRKGTIKIGIMYYPLEFARGGLRIMKKKIFG